MTCKGMIRYANVYPTRLTDNMYEMCVYSWQNNYKTVKN